MGLTICPIRLRDANAFIKAHHRHHVPPQGMRFAVGAMADRRLVAVAVTGHPVARLMDDGWTLEVTRLCADGSARARNACSLLYAACARAGRAMGYRRVITYILDEEPGTSLMAAGWRRVRDSGGGTWHREARPREDKHPLGPKQLWIAPGCPEEPMGDRPPRADRSDIPPDGRQGEIDL